MSGGVPFLGAFSYFLYVAKDKRLSCSEKEDESRSLSIYFVDLALMLVYALGLNDRLFRKFLLSTQTRNDRAMFGILGCRRLARMFSPKKSR